MRVRRCCARVRDVQRDDLGSGGSGGSRCVLAGAGFGTDARSGLLSRRSCRTSSATRSCSRPPARRTIPNHAAHFKPGVDQLQTPQQFNQQLVTQLATFPVGSSSGGFTYTFNPSLGTFSRSSESFGPLFAERALTIGRERGSLGVGYQRSTYDTFEGKNLRQREIIFHVQHIDCCGTASRRRHVGDGTRLNPAFEGDIIEAALTLGSPLRRSSFYGTYGLTDRFDLGVAVPLVSIDVDASIRARIERLATAANPTIHNSTATIPTSGSFSASGSATGLGDIVVRAKYNFLPARRRRPGRRGRCADADGRRKQSAGHRWGARRRSTASRRWHSASCRRMSTRVHRFEQGRAAGTSLKDEWNYAAGLDLAVSPRLTLIADVLGRSIRDAGRLREADKVFEFVQTGTGGRRWRRWWRWRRRRRHGDAADRQVRSRSESCASSRAT